MKHLLTVLCLLPALGFAQNIPKHAQGVILSTTAPDSVAFEQAVSLLDSANFLVIRADDKRGRIITDKRIVYSIMAMRLLVDIHRGQITMKGQWFTNYHDYMVYINDNVDLIYKPAGGNEYKCFLELVNLAKALQQKLPGSELSYIPAKD